MTHKCNTLSLNTGAVFDSIKSHFITALELAEEQLISIMREEIQRTTYGQAPGKPKWRDEISGMLKEAYRNVTDEYVEVGVGLPIDLERTALHIFVRAMIIQEGSGSAVGRDPITAGEPGRMVWDSELTGKHPSNAKSKYVLPDQFNQRGNHFIDNAVKRMAKHFSDVLDDAAMSLADAVFYGNVSVR